MLARSYLMTLSVIFRSRVNFPIRSSCILKVFTKKRSGFFCVNSEFFFSKSLLWCRWCSSQCQPIFIFFPESHKWTPKPTFKKREKKEPKLFRILYPVKKQVTSHLKLQRVFLQKHVGVPWANTVRVVFLCNVVSEGSIQHCIGYFSHMGQHYTSNFLVQRWLR